MIQSASNQTINNALISGALTEIGKESGNVRTAWNQHMALCLGVLLTILGIIGIQHCPVELGQRFSDAMLIAGILSVVVDFPLKRKLQVDAARDIFQHLLGISLPEKLRDKLQTFITDNAIYREDLTIDVDVTSQGQNVLLKFVLNATVVAASDSPYEQLFMATNHMNPKIYRASIRRADGKPVYSLEYPQMVPDANEKWVLTWKGEKQQLKRGDKLIQHLEYSIEKPHNDSYHIFFGNSVVYPLVRLACSPNLEVTASHPSELNGNEYLYNHVFLKSGNIEIRWRRKLSGELFKG